MKDSIKDKIEGAVHDAKGAVKEKVGRVTNNEPFWLSSDKLKASIWPEAEPKLTKVPSGATTLSGNSAMLRGSASTWRCSAVALSG